MLGGRQIVFCTGDTRTDVTSELPLFTEVTKTHQFRILKNLGNTADAHLLISNVLENQRLKFL